MNQRLHLFLLVLFTLLLAPVLFIILFLYPSTDDYCLSAFVRDNGWAWTQHFVYTQWGGRFTSTFFLSLDPLVYDALWGYRFMSLLLMSLMAIGIYRVLDILVIPAIDKIQKIVLTLFLFFFLFLLQPSAVEAWYWYASAYTYQLSLVLLLFALPNLCLYALHPEEKKFPYFSVLIFILNLAMNEAIMVVQFVFLLLFVFELYKNKSITTLRYLPWLLLLVAVLALTIFAPGNFNRGEGMLIRITPWLAGWLALKHWLSYSWHWLVIGLPMAYLIRIYTIDFIKAERFDVLSMKQKASLVFLFIALSGLPVFIVYIIANYDPPDRIMNISAFFFLIATLLFAFTLPTPKENLKVWSFALVSFIILQGALNTNAWLQLTDDLLSGRARAYEQEMQLRAELLKTSEEDCLLLPIQNKPLTIFYRELNEEPGKWPNDCYAEFYGKRSVGLKRDVRR